MTKELLSPFAVLCIVGFFARLSYGLARTPVLSLFALSLGASPEVIGFIVGASTITDIFFKLPAGALSDIVGRKTMLLFRISGSCSGAICIRFSQWLRPTYW